MQNQVNMSFNQTQVMNPTPFPTSIGSTIERPCSPDVLLGAYLISHLQQRCENCGISNTPQWRKGWYSTILNRSVVLCNACGLKYNKNQFCPYCMYVYYKEVDKKSKNTWLTCEQCHRWVHIECERKCGDLSNFQPFQSYYCPSCRNNTNNSAENNTHSDHGEADVEHLEEHHHEQFTLAGQQQLVAPSPQRSIHIAGHFATPGIGTQITPTAMDE